MTGETREPETEELRIPTAVRRKAREIGSGEIQITATGETVAAQAAESGETGEITGTAEARGITETKMAGTAETRENAELRITTGTEEARITTAETRMETREPEESRTITAAAARE